MDALKIQGLKFTYPDSTAVINGLNLTVIKGEKVGLVGSNGAGKSTLLLLLMGMLKAQEGHIEVLGKALIPENLAQIRKSAGFVFQNADDQLFMNSLYEDLAFGPRNYGLSEEAVETKVNEVLNKLGITHLKHRMATKLSGGEKRLAAIGTALSLDPEILLMDEPSTGLDPKARRSMIEWLGHMEKTLLITSHDLDLIYETCEKVFVIGEGKILAEGRTAELLSNEALMSSAGLEVPPSLKACRHCGRL